MGSANGGIRMALSDHDLTAKKKGPSCSVGVLMSRMDESDRSTLTAWFDDEDKFSSDITDALNAEFDVSLSSYTVQRHRRGDCKCA